MILNINTDASIAFSNKLEKLRKSALPVAVRSTLNSAAFDVKTNTMPREAQQKFVNRSPNFFKANSKVEQAQGFDIRRMVATVGFTAENAKQNNKAVLELEQQEHGGTIKDRTFIPTSEARGGSGLRLVRPVNRLRTIKSKVGSLQSIPDVKNVRGKNKSELFIKTAIYARKGGYIVANGILRKVDSIKRQRVGLIGRSTTMRIKTSPVYSFRSHRTVNASRTSFMRTASEMSAKKMETFYENEARRQFNKVLK